MQLSQCSPEGKKHNAQHQVEVGDGGGGNNKCTPQNGTNVNMMLASIYKYKNKTKCAQLGGLSAAQWLKTSLSQEGQSNMDNLCKSTNTGELLCPDHKG